MTFGQSRVTLPALQTLIWSTHFSYINPFPVANLDLPSLRHLSLTRDPPCIQVLEVRQKYPKLVSFHVFPAIGKYTPLRLPSFCHFLRLEVLC
jgi:hypothetical protein